MSEYRHSETAGMETGLILSTLSECRLRSEVIDRLGYHPGLLPSASVQSSPSLPLALLIEHSDYARRSAKASLESIGYRVIALGSAQEALELQQGLQTQPDCILLDLSIRDFDITDLLRRIRRQAPRTPIVLASGQATSAQLERIPRDDWTCCIDKPYCARDIQTSLGRFLERQAAA